MAEGLITLETADRPLTYGKSKFPYDACLNSLKNIASTKSVVFKDKECNPNHITHLRNLCKKMNLGHLKACRKDGKVYLWCNEAYGD